LATVLVDVREAGASGDGERDDTAALQAAVDRCVRSGGGSVRLPPGRYLTGTVVLGSHLRLVLEPGATLLGITDPEAYPRHVPALRSYTDNYTQRSLLYAEQATDIVIEGGTIDGQGAEFVGLPYLDRPYLIRFVDCERVRLRDVELRNSAMWVQHYLGCRDVTLDGLTIDSTVNLNNDGIDIDSSERVRISNCDITTLDDAIVIKSTATTPCRDVVVTNCVLSSECNAFKIGTETVGDITDVTATNLTVRAAGRSGIAIESVDGGRIERVAVSNVSMRDAVGGIFVRLGHRGRPLEATGTADDHDPAAGKRPVGALGHVVLSSITTDCDAIGCSITGLPGASVRDVTLRDVTIRPAGGATEVPAEPPELPERYPEYDMYGPLPAYALYCRHVDGLRLAAVDVRAQRPDERPALAFSDCTTIDLDGSADPRRATSPAPDVARDDLPSTPSRHPAPTGGTTT